jgi:hypothetical protein
MIAINYLAKDTKFFKFVLTVLCIFLMIISSDLNSSHGLNSKHAVTLIRKNKSDSTIVFVAPKWIGMVFTYHYNIVAFEDYRHYEKYLNKDNVFVISTANEINLSRLAKASDAILLDGWNNLADTDPNKIIFKTLIHKFGTVDTIVWNSLVKRETGKGVMDLGTDKVKAEGTTTVLKGYTIFHFGRKMSILNDVH